jgi:hypothetical protein
MKTCARCKILKPHEDFYKNKKSKDGLSSYCSSCCKAAVTASTRKHAGDTDEAVKQRRRDAYKDKYRHQARLRYHQKREELIEYQKQWHAENKVSVKQYRSRFYAVVANRIYRNANSRYADVAARKIGRSPIPFTILLGCNKTQLFEHMVSLFTEGMTGDNYGEWEIDHIRPICSFDLTDMEQMRQCFHYTNMQPLWREENRAKGITWSE